LAGRNNRSTKPKGDDTRKNTFLHNVSQFLEAVAFNLRELAVSIAKGFQKDEVKF
jgi:hypothetical protein